MKIFETKQNRKARQDTNFNEMVEELTESVSQMFKRKVAKDAFYIHFNNIEESVNY